MSSFIVILTLIALASFLTFLFCEIFEYAKKAGVFEKIGLKERKECILRTLKRWYFLFRWFIIGKYHCEMKNKCSKKAFKTIRWALLFFIIYSCTMSLAGLIELVRPLLLKVFA